MNKIRFFTNNIGPCKENEIASLKKAIELANGKNGTEKVVILLHTKKNTGYIERTIGKDNTKILIKGDCLTLENGLEIKLETIRTFDDFGDKIILLTYGLRSQELFKYDNFDSVTAIVGHQWSENELKDWAESWGAEEVITGSKLSKMNNLDNVMKCALDDLTRNVNMSTGINNSMDEDLCKTYLRALYKYGYVMNEKDVASYLITEKGWDAEHTNDVIKLVSKLNSGSYFIGGEKTGLKHYIKKWEKAIDDNEIESS